MRCCAAEELLDSIMMMMGVAFASTQIIHE
jgi:hypothetical protein